MHQTIIKSLFLITITGYNELIGKPTNKIILQKLFQSRYLLL